MLQRNDRSRPNTTKTLSISPECTLGYLFTDSAWNLQSYWEWNGSVNQADRMVVTVSYGHP